jgi:hypothetical protein
MASYLPKESNAGSAYQEGGGLYALGRLPFRNHNNNLNICFAYNFVSPTGL